MTHPSLQANHFFQLCDIHEKQLKDMYEQQTKPNMLRAVTVTWSLI